MNRSSILFFLLQIYLFFNISLHYLIYVLIFILYYPFAFHFHVHAPHEEMNDLYYGSVDDDDEEEDIIRSATETTKCTPFINDVRVFKIELGQDSWTINREKQVFFTFWSTSVILFVCWAFLGYISLAMFLALIFVFRLVSQSCRPVPSYWDETVDQYRQHIRSIGVVWQTAIGRTSWGYTGVIIFVMAGKMLTLCVHLGLLRHSREILALAQRAQTSIGDLVVMQYVYEACACCTAVVFLVNKQNQKQQQKTCVHLRCMDWEMPFELRPVTFVIEAHIHGRHIFTATTWPAYVGVLTGIRMKSSNSKQSCNTGDQRIKPDVSDFNLLKYL